MVGKTTQCCSWARQSAVLKDYQQPRQTNATLTLLRCRQVLNSIPHIRVVVNTISTIHDYRVALQNEHQLSTKMKVSTLYMLARTLPEAHSVLFTFSTLHNWKETTMELCVPSDIPHNQILHIIQNEMAQVVYRIWYLTVANEPEKITASCS